MWRCSCRWETEGLRRWRCRDFDPDCRLDTHWLHLDRCGVTGRTKSHTLTQLARCRRWSLSQSTPRAGTRAGGEAGRGPRVSNRSIKLSGSFRAQAHSRLGSQVDHRRLGQGVGRISAKLWPQERRRWSMQLYLCGLAEKQLRGVLDVATTTLQRSLRFRSIEAHAHQLQEFLGKWLALYA